MKPHNLVEMLALTVKRHPEKVAIRYKEQAFTYQRVWNMIRDIAFGLERLGVRQGTKVAIIAENHPHWIICDFAIMSLGGVTVPLSPEATEQKWSQWIRHAEAEIVIIGPSPHSHMSQPPSHVRHVIQLGGLPSSSYKALQFDTVIQLGQTIALEELDWAYPAVQPSDLATIQFTRGTTGEHKAVMLSHAQLLHSLDGISYLHPYHQEDDILTIAPVSHLYARLTGFLLPLGSGASITIAEGTDPPMQQVHMHKPTLLITAPSIIQHIQQQLLQHVRRAPWRKLAYNHAVHLATKYHRYRLKGQNTPIPVRWRFGYAWAHLLSFSTLHRRLGGRLRLILSSGDPVDQSLHTFFGHMGLPLVSLYGTTEAGYTIARQYSYHTDPTTFQLLPQVEARLLPDGELLVKSPSTAVGYYNNESLTEKRIRYGWIHTGDLATYTRDGQLQLQGRKLAHTEQETDTTQPLNLTK
ncbi:AMP-binding protein [Laceyella putida]|uniref:AMP-binding protein n=1 Tax=Laceyella putida TaxID=110101 RepID=A0ABW2RMZ0_9BACL